MEIIDYLRIAKRRWWILVLVPLLAVGATAAVIFAGAATYTSTATVSSGSLVGIDGSPFTGTQSGPQFVSAFQAAAQNPSAQAAVAKATGVGATDQASGLTITPVGTSSDLLVTFVGTNKDAVGKVSAETARQAIRILFSARAIGATASKTHAEGVARAANDAIAALSKKYGIADPPRAYQSALNQVASLQQQQAGLLGGGKSIGAAALDAPIAAANAAVAGYVPILADYNNLASVQSAANNDLTQAQAEWRHATALEAAGQAGGVIDVADTSPVNKLTSSAPLLGAILGAALFLAVVLVFLVEVVQRLRAASRPTAKKRRREAAAPLSEGEVGASEEGVVGPSEGEHGVTGDLSMSQPSR